MTQDIIRLPIRTFSPDQDIPRLLSLYAAVEAADQEGIEISEQTIVAQLNLPGHNPALDRWVIDGPDGSSSLIASALIILSPGTKIANANIIVHPNSRNRGVGSLLLSKVNERAYQLKADSIQVFVNTKHTDASDFLQKRGFISQGAYTELRLTKDIRLPPVIWPYGYTVHPYSEILDHTILTQAMNLSYIPLWGHREVTENEIASWLPEFNQQGLFLVFSEKGRVIGISRVEPSPERTRKNGNPTGYIDAPGVVPQHRRLDLYRALVLTGINWLYNQNQTLIEMESWGDKLEVLKMYRELGFMDIRQLVSYELKLIQENPAR
jgi:mycothiol synthase